MTLGWSKVSIKRQSHPNPRLSEGLPPPSPVPAALEKVRVLRACSRNARCHRPSALASPLGWCRPTSWRRQFLSWGGRRQPGCRSGVLGSEGLERTDAARGFAEGFPGPLSVKERQVSQCSGSSGGDEKGRSRLSVSGNKWHWFPQTRPRASLTHMLPFRPSVGRNTET